MARLVSDASKKPPAKPFTRSTKDKVVGNQPAQQTSTSLDDIISSLLATLRWDFIPAGSNHRSVIEETLAPFDDLARSKIIKGLQGRAEKENSHAGLLHALKDLQEVYNRKERCHEKLTKLWETSEYIPVRYRPNPLSRDLLQELWMLSREARDQNRISDLWDEGEQEGILPSLMTRAGKPQKLSVSVVKEARLELKQSRSEGKADTGKARATKDQITKGPEGLSKDIHSPSDDLGNQRRESLARIPEDLPRPNAPGASLQHSRFVEIKDPEVSTSTKIGEQLRDHDPDSYSADIERGRRARSELSDNHTEAFPLSVGHYSDLDSLGQAAEFSEDDDEISALVHTSGSLCEESGLELSPQTVPASPSPEDFDWMRSSENEKHHGHVTQNIAPILSKLIENPTKISDVGKKRKLASITVDDDAIERIVPFPSLRQGLRSMRREAMLNDDAISILIDRLRSDNVHIVGTHEIRSSEDYRRRNGFVPRWVQRDTLPASCKVLVPLHDERSQHWSLVIAYMDDPRIELYDSLGNTLSPDRLTPVRNFLSALRPDRSFSEAAFNILEGPRQQNSLDCGIYLLKAARDLVRLQSLHGPWEIKRLRTEYAAKLSSSDYAAPSGYSRRYTASRMPASAMGWLSPPLRHFLDEKHKHASRIDNCARALTTFHKLRSSAFVKLDGLEDEMLAFAKARRQRAEQIKFVDYSSFEKSIASTRPQKRDAYLKRRAQLIKEIQAIDEALARDADEDEREKSVFRNIHPQLLALKALLIVCSVIGSQFTESQQALRRMQGLETKLVEEAKL